jgi:KDO2-lipid IV(A) lauroyltransferase
MPEKQRKRGTFVPDRVRFILEYAALRAVAAILMSLGVERASAASGKIWRLAAPYNRRHKAALRHLEVAFPKLNSNEREHILADAWDNIGRTAAETLMIRRIEPSRVRQRSAEIMDLIARSGGRAVIASLHSGNWELIAPVFKAADFRLGVIYRHVKNPLFERYLRDVRKDFYPGGMHLKGGPAPRKLMAWVKSGNPVLILADQRGGNVHTTFFGHDARATPLPAFIAHTLDVPLIAARIVRTSGVNFALDLEAIHVPKTESRAQDIEQSTRELQGRFEAWIREVPEQWMWSHRRWSREGPPVGWREQNPPSWRGS